MLGTHNDKADSGTFERMLRGMNRPTRSSSFEDVPGLAGAEAAQQATKATRNKYLAQRGMRGLSSLSFGIPEIVSDVINAGIRDVDYFTGGGLSGGSYDPYQIPSASQSAANLATEISGADIVPREAVPPSTQRTGDWVEASVSMLPIGAAPLAPALKGGRALMKSGISGRDIGKLPMEENLASRVTTIYDFPVVNRLFTTDYPSGAAVNDAGKLLADIDGRPFNADARFVAGRRVVGDSEEALGPQELVAFGEAGTGRRVEAIAPSKIDGDVGRVTVNRYTREPEQVYLSNKLSESEAEKVMGHESGHVINQILKELPLPKGRPLQELKHVYNRGNNTDLAMALSRGYDIEKFPRKVYKGVTPEAMGYKGAKVPGEYWAEAFRAYMASPGWFKSVAPEAAAIIRRHANNHPKLKDLIQFNSLAAATAPVGLLGYLAEQNEQ